MPESLTDEQKDLKVIEVHWVDSVSDDGRWIDKDASNKWAKGCLGTIRTVGFLIHEDKEQIVVGHSVSENNRMFLLAIPKVAIVKRWYYSRRK